MKGKLKLVDAPNAEPLSYEDASSYLYDFDESQQPVIAGLITAATQFIEQKKNLVFITSQYEYHFDEFPYDDESIGLPRYPVSAVDSITYIDEAGAEQTWASANYQTDLVSINPRIFPAVNESYPATQCGKINAVKVTFTAGYGTDASDVPARERQAIGYLVNHWFENRDTVNIGSISKPMEFTLNALLGQGKQFNPCA